MIANSQAHPRSDLFEQADGFAVFAMVSECEVPWVYHLVADLTLVGVPEGAVQLESILVSVGRTSIASDGLRPPSGGADPALLLPTVDLVKVLLVARLLADYEHLVNTS